jgi:hypothetical protein
MSLKSCGEVIGSGVSFPMVFEWSWADQREARRAPKLAPVFLS